MQNDLFREVLGTLSTHIFERNSAICCQPYEQGFGVGAWGFGGTRAVQELYVR